MFVVGEVGGVGDVEAAQEPGYVEGIFVPFGGVIECEEATRFIGMPRERCR